MYFIVYYIIMICQLQTLWHVFNIIYFRKRCTSCSPNSTNSSDSHSRSNQSTSEEDHSKNLLNNEDNLIEETAVEECIVYDYDDNANIDIDNVTLPLQEQHSYTVIDIDNQVKFI